ncbi:MAG: hypothetical protein IKW89_08865 [Bacteroidales bacterium]|nr:hypothetical protein [Bacteroidales bacterium]
MIKKISKYSLAVLLISVFVLMGCDKTGPAPYDPIPESVMEHFSHRYPGATLLSDRFIEDYQGWAELEFVDSDGFKATAHYKEGIWMMTNKVYSKENFIYQIPRKVARAYVGTGVDNEDYLSDNSYVMEISRRYFEKKQYEFCFEIPYEDEDAINGVIYESNTIAIDEDGDLLYYEHNYVNPSYWWRDITPSLNSVIGFLPAGSTILGSVNEAGNNLIFFKDNGIIKTAKSSQGRNWDWEKTYFPIDRANLTEAAAKVRDEFLSEHEDFRFTTLYDVEDRFGKYYGLKFEKGDWNKAVATDWSATTIYIPAE